MHITEFSERYEAEVSNGPEIQALRTGIHKVGSHIQTMKIQHQALSDANAEHGVVRHISEALGSPSPLEIAILRETVKQNAPHMKHEEALALENLLAEKEAETGNYPKLKDNEQGEGIWHNPDLQLAAAERFYEAGQIELALGALSECEESTTLATSRFAGYERRVMGGAGIAVTWLERAKTAGKVASAFTGTGGVVRAAFGAAGYTFAQEGSQQVVAHWIDPSNKIDLGGLAEQAAIEGLASLFGGVTQGAFVEALTARFGARLLARGWSKTMTKTAISAWGATTASFYNVPAKIVLDRVIAGKAMPSSLAEVSKMVVDEAITAAPMDLAGSFVHATSAKPEPAVASEPGGPHAGPEIAPPREVVDSLAGSAGRTGAEPAAPMAAGERGPAPKTIIAEARMIAGHLEPLRHEWANLSPAMRAERLVAGVHEALAASGLPKPVAILKKEAGGLFHKDTWIIEIEGSLLKRDNLSVEEFAWACEIARHEMEHAMQFFRIARREHARTGEDAKTLADRLHMPIERVQEAIDSNAGKREAEPMPAGGAVDASTAAIYDNVYDPVKKEHRREVLGKLDGAISALKKANDSYGPRIASETDPVLLRKLSDEWQAIEREHRPTVEEYRNFPEEVPAFKAGGEVAAAVKEQARLADTLRAARLAERKAYAGATQAWDAARGALADTSKRVPTTTRASINRATREWIGSLDATRKAEHDLITVLESGT